MRALALMLCWNWLIVKAWHAQPIGFAMAWAAGYVVSVLLIKSTDLDKTGDSDSTTEILKNYIFAAVLYPIAIVIAWIASHFL